MGLHTFSDTTLINADKCNKNNNDTVAFTLPNIHYIFLKFIIQMQAK